MTTPAPPISPTIAIVRTGCANLASVLSALARLGVAAEVTDDPARIASAAGVILPGVGHFGPAMRSLRERGLDLAIEGHIENGRPLLAICLGMQLLCEASDESPGVPGIGVIPGRITRFPTGVLIPQMGWNRIQPTAEARLLRVASVYFANSFRLDAIPDGWSGATSDHGGPFVASIERGSLLACQFHPELSGPAGLDLISRWLAKVILPEVASC